MKDNITIDAEKIHIRTLRTISGNIDCPPELAEVEVDGHKFSFNLRSGLMLDEKMVGLKLEVTIQAIGSQQEELPITGAYTHEMVFEIDNLEDFIDSGNGTNGFHATLGSTLVGIIYSTVRGIIFVRTQGTSLGSVVLPVIAPLKLMGIEDEDITAMNKTRKKDLNNK